MEYIVNAQIRSIIGNKRAVRRLRTQGVIPAVAYGPGIEKPLSLVLNSIDFLKLFKHITESTPLSLIISDESGKETFKHMAFIKMVQYDKVTDEIKHIDFYIPEAHHKMKINVPIKFNGKPVGVEKGGTMEIIHHEVVVEAIPELVPEVIEIDVTNLGLGNVIRVKDIQMPQDVKIDLDPEETLVTVITPRSIEEEITAPAAEGEAEPEVVKKGKKEETEEK